jgi:hypothetical protein
MKLFPSREILKRRADIALIAAFFVFIWLPTADSILHLDQAASPNENRPPATYPTFRPTLAGTREFFAGIEAWFSDRFGFRRQLVRWEQRLKWNLFRDSRIANVLVGNEGWLYFSDGRTVDDFCGARPFSDEDLEEWRMLLTGRRDWLRQRGIRYLFVIPPDKQSIYPEHLPDWLIGRARSPRRIDQLLSFMRGKSDVPILDLRETLLEAKKLGQVYLQTDTHWNERGAIAAYRRIVSEAASLGVPITAPAGNAFVETVFDQGGGDLARMLGQEAYLPERHTPILWPQPPLGMVDVRADTKLITKAWIPGIEPQVSENPGVKGKIVMFRDSFAITLSKFLGYSFGRVVYVWQQNWDRRIIESEKPDIVVDEMLERFVISRDPRELRKGDDQPETQLIGDR